MTTLRDAVISAMKAELLRQANLDAADAPWIADGSEFAFPADFVKIDGAIDLGALADAALAAMTNPVDQIRRYMIHAGFDPASMDEAEMERWRAWVAARP